MRRIICLVLVTQLGACAPYTIANIGVYSTTGRGIADHTATAVIPNADCNSLHLFQNKYYCEIRDPGLHYNRNAF